MLKRIETIGAESKTGRIRKIIRGENALVLPKLLTDFQSSVKCIYIDPPYNNGEAYSHFNDSKHEEWLDTIKYRLDLLRQFLREDGTIWISIDDGELHYLKVCADQVFGRDNFITTIVWQHRTTRENRRCFSNNHEYILVYARRKSVASKALNKLSGTPELLSRYKNPDSDKRGPWQSVSINVQAGHAVANQFYCIQSPSGKKHFPPNGRCWAYNESKLSALIADERIWFGVDGTRVPRLKKFLSESTLGLTPETLWLAKDVGTNKEAKKHLLRLFPKETVFDTPKPERLIQRIFSIATNHGDLVLDAYLGAGASAAVAHKMGRQYIGIDSGEHTLDMVVKRMHLVQQGKDFGISYDPASVEHDFEVIEAVEGCGKPQRKSRRSVPLP